MPPVELAREAGMDRAGLPLQHLEMVTISLKWNAPLAEEEPPMARNELRPIIRLRSTAGTGYTYVTRANRRNDPDRLVLRKYDPVARQHVPFREER